MNRQPSAGTFYTVGVGPGDPELISIKAARIIGAAPVIAYFAKRGGSGHAYRIAQSYIPPRATLLRFDYPYTTELAFTETDYRTALHRFYDEVADAIANRLDRGTDVALLCEGDPFFFGSSMYVFDRLAERGCRAEIIPGITGMSGCWARAKAPMVHGDDVMSVLPATLPAQELGMRLGVCDAAVIMKLGGNLPAVRDALASAGLTERAIYVEYGTMENERVMPFTALQHDRAPYFSLVLVPGRTGTR